MTPGAPNTTRVLRWSMVLVATVLSAALMANAFFSGRNLRRAATSLGMAEGQAIFRRVEVELAATGPPDTSALESILESVGPPLLALTLTTPDGSLVATTGSSEDVEVALDAPGPVFEVVSEGRWRLMDRLRERRPRDAPRAGGPRRSGPPPGDPPDRRSARQRPAGPGAGGPPPRHPPPVVVLDYEPSLALETQQIARQNLLLGLLASAVALLAAGLIWRLLEQQERARARSHEERRLRSLGEMSAVLAHEIRNPLASLKGNAQLLSERLAGGTPERRKADLLVRESTRLQRLTTDLLELARSQKPSATTTDVRELARATVAAMDLPSDSLDDSRAPATWTLDADRMQQVLTNLLQNAVQASADGVSLEVAEERGHLVLTVRDRGPGVPDEQRTRIFEPFFTTRTRGTGLGLAVSRRIVEMHGGTIEAKERPGGGSVFTVRLPDAAPARSPARKD